MIFLRMLSIETVNAMGILANAPQGFSSAVSAINSLPQGILAEMCQDVVAFLRYQPGFIDIDNFKLTISSLKIEPQPDVQNCVNALTFIFRAAAQEKLSADDLVGELKSSLEWSEGAMAVVRHVWKEEGPALISMPQETLSVGQLVSMDWKLGVAMSSSSCRSLNSPYVSLQLRIADAGGNIRLQTVEMTIPEFQNFSSQIKEMASTLETAA